MGIGLIKKRYIGRIEGACITLLGLGAGVGPPTVLALLLGIVAYRLIYKGDMGSNGVHM